MARALKPYVVDEVASPNGLIRAPVYFDRERKDFFVQISGRDDQVRADTVDEVKRRAQELLAKCVAYKWEPIILIETEYSWEERHSTFGSRPSDGQFGASVEFKFRRLERSPNPVKPEDWIYRSHTLDFNASEPTDRKRRDREANKDLENCWTSEGDAIISYDGPTWVGLLALKKSVDEAHAQLKSLVQCRDLADRLRLVGTSPQVPLLPAAVGESKRRR